MFYQHVPGAYVVGMGVVLGVVVVVGGGDVGQACGLHATFSLALPVQFAPPFAGRGFVQDLSR